MPMLLCPFVEKIFSRRSVSLTFLLYSFIVMTLCTGWLFLAAMSFSFLIILIHASFRIRNLKTSARFEFFLQNTYSDMKKRQGFELFQCRRPWHFRFCCTWQFSSSSNYETEISTEQSLDFFPFPPFLPSLLLSSSSRFFSADFLCRFLFLR